MRSIIFLCGMPSGNGPTLTWRFLGGSEPALGALIVFVFSTSARDGGVVENGRHWLYEAALFSSCRTERSDGLELRVECEALEQNRRANACVTVLHCCVTGADDRTAAQEGRKRAIGRVLLMAIRRGRSPISNSGVCGPWRRRTVGRSGVCFGALVGLRFRS